MVVRSQPGHIFNMATSSHLGFWDTAWFSGWQIFYGPKELSCQRGPLHQGKSLLTYLLSRMRIDVSPYVTCKCLTTLQQWCDDTWQILILCTFGCFKMFYIWKNTTFRYYLRLLLFEHVHANIYTVSWFIESIKY